MFAMQTAWSPAYKRAGDGHADPDTAGVASGYGRGASTAPRYWSDINLDIEEGEFVAIVGFSGSGKTTLISLIAGLIAPEPVADSSAQGGRPVTGPAMSAAWCFSTTR